MSYGDKLKYLRNRKGLSQKELTDRLHINRSTYARYETSSTQPDFDTLSKLADFFDVSTDYLLGRAENPTASSNSSNIERKLTDEEEFQAFANDPELERWYRELPESEEEDLQALRQMWEIIKKNRK